jgi:hypothetical protein
MYSIERHRLTMLCLVPSGNFAAKGSQNIPSNYASMIPSIAFSVPDLDGEAKLQLKAADGGQDLACIQSSVNNGRTVEVPAVSYVAAGVAGAALLLTGVSALEVWVPRARAHQAQASATLSDGSNPWR